MVSCSNQKVAKRMNVTGISKVPSRLRVVLSPALTIIMAKTIPDAPTSA